MNKAEKDVHFTYGQLREFIAGGSDHPEISKHLEACQACYESYLIVQLTEYAAGDQSERPTEQFLHTLENRLKPRSRIPQWLGGLAAAASIIVGLVLFFPGTSKDTTLAFMRGEVYINGAPAAHNQRLKIGDEVRTGEESLAVIRFGSRADISVLSATKISLLKISEADIPEIIVSQLSGYTFSRVEKGRASYAVHSDSFTAEVKGTQFAVNLEHVKNKIKLAEGKLLIRGKIIGGQSELLAPHAMTLSAAGFESPVKFGQNENAYFADFAAIPAAGKPPFIGADLPEEQIQRIIAGEEEKWTIPELRKRYGKISIVYLKTGDKYTGGFYARDGNLVVHTTERKLRIPTTSVQKVLPY